MENNYAMQERNVLFFNFLYVFYNLTKIVDFDFLIAISSPLYILNLAINLDFFVSKNKIYRITIINVQKDLIINTINIFK